MTRAEIVAAARARLGTRWEHQGRGARLDCVGLVHAAGSVETPIPADYERQPTGRLRKSCDEFLTRIKAPALGSVALMKFDGDAPHHMGIIGDYPLGGFSLIHSYAKARKVVEHRLDQEWLGRCVGFYDFRGVA